MATAFMTIATSKGQQMETDRLLASERSNSNRRIITLETKIRALEKNMRILQQAFNAMKEATYNVTHPEPQSDGLSRGYARINV